MSVRMVSDGSRSLEHSMYSAEVAPLSTAAPTPVARFAAQTTGKLAGQTSSMRNPDRRKAAPTIRVFSRDQRSKRTEVGSSASVVLTSKRR